MATHRISVTVDTGSIRVEPDTLTMTSNDEVHWLGTNARQFSIVFDNEGPFAQREMAHAHATTRQKPIRNGRFKYSVISSENPGLKLDPVVIVGEPPTGQTP